MFYEIIGGCCTCTAIGLCLYSYINNKNKDNEITKMRNLIEYYNKNSDITNQIILKKNEQDKSIYINLTIKNNNIAFKINSQGNIEPIVIRGWYFDKNEDVILNDREKSKKQIIRLLTSIFKKKNIKIYTVNDNEFSYNYNTLKEIFNDNDNNSLFKEDNTIDFKGLYERLNKKLEPPDDQKKNNRKSKYDTNSVNSITNNTKIAL